MSLLGTNYVKLNLAYNVKTHYVVGVMHTIPFIEPPEEIANPVPQAHDPIPVDGEDKYEFEKILSHRKRGKGFHL